MRVGVIGLGKLARKAYMPLLGSWEGLDLLLCSRTFAAVEQIEQQYHLPLGTANVDELLSWHPQAAIVLTPNETHRDIVERLLQAGVDVLVEKPATMSSSEVWELGKLAEARGRILMVTFNRRYAPLHQRAKALWGDRPIGICLMEKYRPGAVHPDLYANYYDDTIHQIDLLRFFCGDGQAVSTVQQLLDGKLVGAVSTVALQGGGYAMVITGLQAGRWAERFSLHGGGASMHVDAFSRMRLVTAAGEQVWEMGGGDWTPTLESRGFAGLLTHFFECVRTRQQPMTSASEAWKTQRLLEDMVERVTKTL